MTTREAPHIDILCNNVSEHKTPKPCYKDINLVCFGEHSARAHTRWTLVLNQIDRMRLWLRERVLLNLIRKFYGSARQIVLINNIQLATEKRKKKRTHTHIPLIASIFHRLFYFIMNSNLSMPSHFFCLLLFSLLDRSIDRARHASVCVRASSTISRCRDLITNKSSVR